MDHEQAFEIDQLDQQADQFLAEYREVRQRCETAGRAPGDDLEAKTRQLIELPQQNTELATRIFTALADSESETEQLVASDYIGYLAKADPAASMPIWSRLLDRDSIVRDEAWETLMGQGAGENCLTFSQAAPLIMHYLGKDPFGWTDDSGTWHSDYEGLQ